MNYVSISRLYKEMDDAITERAAYQPIQTFLYRWVSARKT